MTFQPDDVIPTVTLRAYIEVDDHTRIGKSLTLLVPGHPVRASSASRRATDQLFAELALELAPAITERILAHFPDWESPDTRSQGD